MNLSRPCTMLALTAALLCGAMPCGVVLADDDRPGRQAERDRDRGDDLREPHAGGDHAGPPHEGPPEDDRRGRRQPMTDAEVESARQIIAELYPELAARMDALYEESPDKLRRTIEKRFSRVRFLVKLQERNPAMFELRMSDIRLGRETHALAQRVKQAHLDDDKKTYKALYAELEDKLAAHFDVKQRVRQAELDLLRQRVEELEADLEDRDDERDDLIEQRLNELVGPEW